METNSQGSGIGSASQQGLPPGAACAVGHRQPYALCGRSVSKDDFHTVVARVKPTVVRKDLEDVTEYTRASAPKSGPFRQCGKVRRRRDCYRPVDSSGSRWAFYQHRAVFDHYCLRDH